MNLIQSTLIHKIIPPQNSSAIGAPCLILLHGRGANEDDLLGLSDFFDDRLFIISVRAPFNFQYAGGFTWFDILENGKPDQKMFTESYRKLTEFYDDIVRGYPVNQKAVFLFGFSMGSIISYIFTLNNPDLVAGTIANSGYLPEFADQAFKPEKIKGFPFFIAHGIYDSIIPIQLCRKTRDLLKNAGAEVDYHEYPMEHQISEESMADMSRWLSERLRGSFKK